MYGELNINKITPLTGTSLVIRQWDGWIDANETWTYASADSPTFTFTITGDVTTKYWPGMRIKLFQTTVKYFIITAVAYASPNTTITVYGGTDYTLTSGAITLPFYSSMKAPLGFPLDPAKWTVEVTNTSVVSQVSPVNDTWYNINSFQIVVPIGAWYLSYHATPAAILSATGAVLRSTLSTSSSSESNSHLTSSTWGVNTYIWATFYRIINLVVSSKTTYYLLATVDNTCTTLYIRGSSSATILRAVCAYL